jgi:hypothetical protein
MLEFVNQSKLNIEKIAEIVRHSVSQIYEMKEQLDIILGGTA